MRSSDARRSVVLGALAFVWLWSADAAAQPVQAQGFAVDRLYLSAPGAGWLVMDTLDMHGELGGAVALTTDYAHNPLRLTPSNGGVPLAIVSDEAIADFGFAATYGPVRAYLNLDVPLTVAGQSGVLGNYQFKAPKSGQMYTQSGVNLGTAPDAFADARLGVDLRLVGSPESPFRLGVGAQLFAPSPNTLRSEYLTDDTFRAMFRLLFAGDVGILSYAGHVGVHVRPLDDAPIPGSPQGGELLFGVAAGPKLLVGPSKEMALVIGPEVFGETALRSFFGSNTTGVEGLLSGRLEGTSDDGSQLRVKVGAGAGLDAQFGTPDWRIVVGIELFDRGGDRDKDGIYDAKDACPDRAGIKTHDPKTNGCPAIPSTEGVLQPLDPPSHPEPTKSEAPTLR